MSESSASSITSFKSPQSKEKRKRKISIENRKRKVSKSNWSPQQRVSGWKRQHAEMLHIYYDTEFLKPEQVLLKGGIKPHLTEEQSSHVQQVQTHLKGFTSSINQFDMFGAQVEAEILGLLKNLREGPDLTDLQGSEAIIKLKVRDFIDALSTLLKKIQDRRRHYRNYEGNFKKFVCVFAEMCLLKAQICDRADQSVWSNLKGAHVTSEPDCRFYKYGFNDLHSDDNMFSVIEVKKDLDAEPDSDSDSQQQELGKHWLTSSSDDDISPSISRPSRKIHIVSKDTEEGKHTIKNYFNNRILGQHAGELLLDLHYHGKNKDKKLEFAMPGVIVDGTLLYITMLVMSSNHYKKLKNNEELNDEDQAIIYYSASYDILEEKQRNVLMESFVSFNNAEDSCAIPIQGEPTVQK